MAAMARVGQDQSQDPGASPIFPMWVQEAQSMRPCFTAFATTLVGN